MRFGIAVLLVMVAVVFMALGALELLDPADKLGKASRFFFSLAALAFSAAIGTLSL